MADPDPASALCLACGLCCDGGLFHAVELTEEDRVRLADAGLDAPERLPHPCRHYAAPACSIYGVRPWRCADYRCRVLDSMLDGAIGPQEAHALVDRARALRAEVATVLPAGLTVVQLAEDMRLEAPDSRAPERLQPLVRFVAYRLFVERHFLGPKARWMSRTKA